MRLAHKDGWQSLLSFPLRAGHIISPDAYITYSNAPFDLTPETKAKAEEALRRLMERLEAVRTSVSPGDEAQDDSAGKDAT